ncbi:MAG: CinA family protein [Treponema sp.]|nr:CinA family protein [Treponema sp.]
MLECETEKELIIQAENKAACLIKKLKEFSITLALAESCTAGLVSSLLVETPGASGVLWGSFVCYTKEAKVLMLGLDTNELDSHGLVSRQTACSMALGALKKSGAGITGAVTGLAGPDGDGSIVPVGTVWIAAALKGGTVKPEEFYFTGTRNEIRIRAAISLMELIHKRLT